MATCEPPRAMVTAMPGPIIPVPTTTTRANRSTTSGRSFTITCRLHGTTGAAALSAPGRGWDRRRVGRASTPKAINAHRSLVAPGQDRLDRDIFLEFE